MNWIDFIIIIIVALSTFYSLRTGFLRQALNLVGFAVGIYTALGYHKELAGAFSIIVRNTIVAAVAAFVLILTAVWLAFAVLAAAARRVLKTSGLEWADYFLGMLLGLLMGVFFTVCFLLLLARIPASGISNALKNSALASFILKALPYLRQLLPSELRIFQTI